MSDEEKSCSHSDTARELLLLYAQRQLEAGKWLLASLLLVNGGALVTILSSDLLPMLPSYGFAFAFLLGILLAFGSGAVSWYISDYTGASLRVSLNVRLFSDEHFGESSFTRKGLLKAIYLMWFLSVSSLLSFIIGFGFAVDAFASIDPAGLSR